MKLINLSKSPCALLLSLLVSAAGTSTAFGFDIVNRWGATQLDGGNLQRGAPVTLRWSLVPDGRSYDRSTNSNLIQFLDDGWGVPGLAAARRTSPAGRGLRS